MPSTSAEALAPPHFEIEAVDGDHVFVRLPQIVNAQGDLRRVVGHMFSIVQSGDCRHVAGQRINRHAAMKSADMSAGTAGTSARATMLATSAGSAAIPAFVAAPVAGRLRWGEAWYSRRLRPPRIRDPGTSRPASGKCNP